MARVARVNWLDVGKSCNSFKKYYTAKPMARSRSDVCLAPQTQTAGLTNTGAHRFGKALRGLIWDEFKAFFAEGKTANRKTGDQPIYFKSHLSSATASPTSIKHWSAIKRWVVRTGLDKLEAMNSYNHHDTSNEQNFTPVTATTLKCVKLHNRPALSRLSLTRYRSISRSFQKWKHCSSSC